MKKSDQKFVRNDTHKQAGVRFPVAASFKCAAQGLAHTFNSQRNMKIHLVFAIVAIILGFVLAIPLSSWVAVVVCMGLVLVTECINTALESLVDLVSPEYNRLACYAKDCAAAGVLASALLSLVVAILVFGSALGEIIV